jgi:hypothetical protein
VARCWYKEALIYQLHVRAFAGGNQDGVGDFEGRRVDPGQPWREFYVWSDEPTKYQGARPGAQRRLAQRRFFGKVRTLGMLNQRGWWLSEARNAALACDSARVRCAATRKHL